MVLGQGHYPNNGPFGTANVSVAAVPAPDVACREFAMGSLQIAEFTTTNLFGSSSLIRHLYQGPALIARIERDALVNVIADDRI